MKLERLAAALAFVAVTAGCASRPAPAPLPPDTSTTRTNAATLEVPEPPHVGKVQRSAASLGAGQEDDAAIAPKTPRREDGRHGGFSGYK